MVNEHPYNGENGARVVLVQGVLPTGNRDDRLANDEGDQTGDDQCTSSENVNEERPYEFEDEVGARRAEIDGELRGRRCDADGVQGWTEVVGDDTTAIPLIHENRQ